MGLLNPRKMLGWDDPGGDASGGGVLALLAAGALAAVYRRPARRVRS